MAKSSVNKENPLVSIIIPVYNGAKYLRFAVDSALAQTYKNIEIIVVNDGSTDGGATEKIAKSYGDRIKYFRKKNGGVSTALNFAIEKMKGEYFSWLSHDDTYEPEKVETEVNYLVEHGLLGKKVIIYSDYYLIRKNGKVISRCVKDHNELVRKPEYALLKGNINGLSLLIPKKAFDEHGMFDTKLKCTQDYELWHKMSRAYQFVHIPKMLVSTRYHSEQVSNTSSLVKTEGNALYLGLINDVPKKRREELEGSEYCFFAELANFQEKTPYDEAKQYCRDSMDKILQKVRAESSKHTVSVVIPFHNRRKEVVRALNSVLKQTHKKLEIILVDDGSTDDTSNVVEMVNKHDNAKLFRLVKNSGVSTARNRGIAEATGEYIAFLDSDDEFLPTKIQTQLAYMLASKAPMSHTSYIRRMNGSEKVMHSGTNHGHCERKLMYSCSIATPTVMLDANWLKENKIEFNQEIGLGEDVCFWLEVLKHNYLIGIDEPLTIVYANDTSSAYDMKKQVVGLKNITKFLLNDDYYSQFDTDIARLMSLYIRYVSEMENDEIPEYNDSLVGKVKKFIYFLRKEGVTIATTRVAKKLGLVQK